MKTALVVKFALLSILIVDLVFFLAAYLYNAFLPHYALMMLPYAIIALYFGLTLKKKIRIKVLFIVLSFILGCISGFIFLFVTMFVPGSKEHNNVMYRVCLPALKEYYVKSGKKYSLNETGWREHEICEQNVWAGREPLHGIK